jgi:hypothetical protein
MSERIHKHKEFLCFLQKANKKQLAALVKNADNDQIACICEIAMNVLQGNVKLQESKRRELKKYRQFLRFMSKKSNPISKKKVKLQRGGWILPLLISTIAPLIIDAIRPSS